ncbi:MAG: tetratricopeptide repeat protein [Gammaproteobacteria bacterium]|nr:tetratricopeptide repeat protein [Gammaproteobacteria bacterium]
MDFETEEQQVEALKKWWKENGKQVIFGAVIGFGLIFGWRYYLQYSATQKSEASALFEQVIKDSSDSKLLVDKSAVFEKIKKDYNNTAYFPSAALVLAKAYYDAGNKTEAIEVLDQVIMSNGESVLILVAQERKARILIDLGKADEALDVLSVAVSDEFESIFEELKGDAYVVKGNVEKARNAYDKALLLNKSSDKKFLQMKRDNLGDSLVSPTA